MKKTQTKKLVILALLVAIAIMLNYFERFIPIVIGIPGVRLGMANVVTLITLSMYRFKETLLMVVLRTLLSALFYGSISALMFSLTGGMFALVAMHLAWRFKDRGLSLIGISIIGAVFHNIGQVTMAYWILKTSSIYGYLPLLLASSVITGILIGVVGKKTIAYILKHENYLM